MKILLKVTRYGLSAPPKNNYWDPYGDSSTDKWLGNRGNTLTLSSCALTKSAAEALDARPGDLIKVVCGTSKSPDVRFTFYRTYDDTAPETDMRMDLFFPFRDYPEIPDLGEAVIFARA